MKSIIINDHRINTKIIGRIRIKECVELSINNTISYITVVC